MVVSACGIAVGWMLVAFTSSMPLLLMGRALDGVTSSMQPLTQSYVKDISVPGSLQQNLGSLQGISIGLSFILGAATGGVLTQKKGPRLVFKIAGGIAAAAALIATVFLPESLPQSKRVSTVHVRNPLSVLTVLGENPRSLGASLAFLGFWVGLNGLQSNLFNYGQHRFGWTKVQGVKTQAASGVILSVANAVGPRVLIPMFGARGTVRIGMIG